MMAVDSSSRNRGRLISVNSSDDGSGYIAQVEIEVVAD